MVNQSLISLANRLGYSSLDLFKESLQNTTEANISIGLKSVLLRYGYNNVEDLKSDLGCSSNNVEVQQAQPVVEEVKTSKKSRSKKQTVVEDVVEEVEPIVESSEEVVEENN